MRKATIAAIAAALVLALAAAPAFASNGYFSHGYGTHYKGMAGAGAALPLNSLAPATNPAAMAFLGPRYDASIGLFNPNRYYEVFGNPSGYPGTFGLTPGEVESETRYFPIPGFGANFAVGENAQPARGAGTAEDPAEDGPVGLRDLLVLRDQEVRRGLLVALAASARATA